MSSNHLCDSFQEGVLPCADHEPNRDEFVLTTKGGNILTKCIDNNTLFSIISFDWLPDQ